MKTDINKRRLGFIWATLLLLLFATWLCAQFNLKGLNLTIAISIALAKALLILSFFMELRTSRKVFWALAAIGFLWLLIFFDLALSDYLTRNYTWSLSRLN